MKLARWLMGALMLSVLLLLALGIVWAPDKPVSMLTARWATPPSRFLALDGMQVHLRDEGRAPIPFHSCSCMARRQASTRGTGGPPRCVGHAE